MIHIQVTPKHTPSTVCPDLPRCMQPPPSAANPSTSSSSFHQPWGFPCGVLLCSATLGQCRQLANQLLQALRVIACWSNQEVCPVLNISYYNKKILYSITGRRKKIFFSPLLVGKKGSGLECISKPGHQILAFIFIYSFLA